MRTVINRSLTFFPQSLARYVHAGTLSNVTEEDKFLFDLNGFLVVRNVLRKEDITLCNRAIDNHTEQLCERPNELRNTAQDSGFAGDGKTGRGDLAGMLGWEQPFCQPFRNILTHPKLIPYYHLLLGQGYRLDHQPLVITQEKHADGFDLHGGSVNMAGQFNPALSYTFRNGSIHNSLLAVSVQLCDHNPGDGGFCVVRGSHKMNFPVPEAMVKGKEYQEHVYQPVTRAGDVILFSEATVHGCLPWTTSERTRRIALYRFAPYNMAYGRGYHPQWTDEMMVGLTPAQAAVLEPPYHIRMNRPFLKKNTDPNEEQYSIHVQERQTNKKAFDQKVFNQTYF